MGLNTYILTTLKGATTMRDVAGVSMFWSNILMSHGGEHRQQILAENNEDGGTTLG